MRTQKFILGACALGVLALAACETQDVSVLESTTTELDQNGGVAKSADGKLALTVARGALSGPVTVQIETDREASFDRQVALAYRVIPSANVNAAFELSISALQRAAVVELSGDDEPRELLASRYDNAAFVAIAPLSELRERRYSAWSALIIPNMPCGDGTCTATTGESCATCADDCGACPQPGCGDGTCSSTTAESCSTCPDDCGTCVGCGDGVCMTQTSTGSPPAETCESCSEDCGPCEMPFCGNSVCEVGTSTVGGENCATCSEDCGLCPPVGCGDGICTETATVGAESCSSCQVDCGSCTGTVLQDVTVGRAHVCARGSDSTVWCMGENDRGQLGDGSRADRLTLLPVTVSSTGTPFHAEVISAGGDLTCAVSDQQLYCWGAMTSTSAGSVYPVLVQSVVGPLPPIAYVDVGTHYLCAIDVSGLGWCGGESVSGEELVPVFGVDSSRPSNLVRVSAGGLQRALFVDASGAIYSVQGATYYPSDSFAIYGPVLTTEVGSGFECNRAAPPVETLLCWGSNIRGQLGNGTNVTSTSRDNSTGVTRSFLGTDMLGTLEVSLGLFHGCAIAADPFVDRAVECWGAGTEGQLGDGAFIDRWNSVGMKNAAGVGFTSVTDVAAGDSSTCITDNGGRLLCTGLLGRFQLGHNGKLKLYSDWH